MLKKPAQARPNLARSDHSKNNKSIKKQYLEINFQTLAQLLHYVLRKPPTWRWP